MICGECKGEGVTLFLGNESKCKPCKGSGEMVMCSQYSHSPNALVVFRNQPCWNCGIRENDHINMEASHA